MIVARRQTKSDLAILKDSARGKLSAFDRWLSSIEWDTLACRVLGHKWQEGRERDARTRQWTFVVRCKRCRCVAGFKASNWSREDEAAARRANAS